MPSIIDVANDWTPCRTTPAARGAEFRREGDGPDLSHRIRSGQAWYTSSGYSGQAANDNEDWPLAKLLRTEGNLHCLEIANFYRDLHDLAEGPTQLIGREADSSFHLVRSVDKDGKDKGLKVVTGKKATVNSAPMRNRAAPVPKKWNGDWPLLAAIDARRDLAYLRAKIGFVPKILEAFEWAVVDGLTLSEIAERHGAGNKGAKGAARARISDGFGIVDRYRRRRKSLAA